MNQPPSKIYCSILGCRTPAAWIVWFMNLGLWAHRCGYHLSLDLEKGRVKSIYSIRRGITLDIGVRPKK